MKFRTTLFNVLIFVFVLSPFIPGLQYTTLHAATQTANTELTEQQRTTLLETLEQLNELLDSAKKILQNIVDQINSGYIQASADTIEIITDTKRFINKIKGEITKEKRKVKETGMSEDFILDTLHTITAINDIVGQLKTHIDQQIAAGLKKFRPFYLNDSIFTRNVPIDELHINRVKDAIRNNTDSLATLGEKSKIIGLSRWKKAWRKTEPFVKWWHDHIPTEKLILAGTFAGWGYYRFLASDETKDKWGYPVVRLEGGNLHLIDQEKYPLRLFGSIEAFSLMAVFGQNAIAGHFTDRTASTADRHRWYANFKKFCWNKYREWCGRQVKNDTGDGLEEINPRFVFSDLVGLHHQKLRLQEILPYLEDPEGHDIIGVKPRTGYLLFGPPRTGKSMLAEALAGEIKRILEAQGRKEVKFFQLSVQYIKSRGMEQIMYLAKKHAPCILFIDDLDLLGLKREEDKSLLAEFLNVISGCRLDNSDELVIILATTNKQEHMDYALRAAGRIEIGIPFELPTIEERREFFEKEFKRLAVPLETINIKQLALETENCNYGQLNTIIQVAHLKATLHDSVISQDILDEVLDEEIKKIIPMEHKNIPEAERKIIAMHQAGHALSLLLNKTKYTLSKVTIGAMVADIQEEAVMQRYWCREQAGVKHGDVFAYRTADNLDGVETRQDKLNAIKYLMAGHAAEELLLSEHGLQCAYSYHKHDQQQALIIARDLVLKGINFEQFPQNMQEEIWRAAQQLVETCHEEVISLLRRHKQELKLIVDALLTRTTLSAHEVKVIMGMEEPVKSDDNDTEQLTNLEDLLRDLNVTAD